MIGIFKTPTPTQIRQKQLEQYEIYLIKTEEAALYNKKMVEFYNESILKLRKQIE